MTSGCVCKVDWALAHAARAFCVAPVRPNSKAGIKGWSKNATTDESQIRQWFTENPDYNIGCVPGASGLVVIDVDSGGEETLAALVRELGPLPPTFEVETPSGGRHLYFKSDIRPTGARNLGAGLDTRGDGGLALLPGSTIDGREYLSKGDRPPAILPEAWQERFRDISSTNESRKAAPGIDFDHPEAIARARAYIRGLIGAGDVAVEGSGGNDRTYRLAAALRDMGLTQETALDEAAAWNEACAPPWSEEEFAGIFEHAWRYAQNEPGAKSVTDGGAGFEAIDTPDIPAPGDKLRAVSFDVVLDRRTAPVEELVPGLIEKRIPTFLAGPGGSNKSRLALQFALSVGAGHPIFGLPVRRMSSVFVSSEDHADEVARRAQAIASKLSLPRPLDAHFLDRQGEDSVLAVMAEGGSFDLRPFYAQLKAFLRSINGHKLVVLDSCYDFVAFAGKAKIDEGAVNAFVKRVLQNLCDECDATLIVIWHPSQAGMEREDAAGWSVAWHNAPRARLSIAPVKDCEDAFELKVVKRNHGAKGKPVTLHWSDGALLPLSDASIGDREKRLRDACARVAILSAEQGVPIQSQRRLYKWQLDEIEKEAGVRPSDREVKNLLHEAVARGALRKLSSSRHRTAGFYPFDNERAVELARQAKQRFAQDEVPNEQ